MFAGEAINETEGRAVLHTALRRPRTDTLTVDGQDAVAAARLRHLSLISTVHDQLCLILFSSNKNKKKVSAIFCRLKNSYRFSANGVYL